MMTSEEAELSAGALQRLCVEEERFLVEEHKAQTRTVDCDNGHWKSSMKPLRLEGLCGDGGCGAMPAMDVVRAVGTWRALNKRSTLDILEDGTDSFRAIDMRNGCILGIPLLCPGGVEREGQPSHEGGSWVEKKGKEGSATAAEIISTLLIALRSTPTAISSVPTTEELAVRGQANYRFARTREGRSLIRPGDPVDEEMQPGDIVIVVAPFSTDNGDDGNVKLKVGDWGTFLERDPSGWVSVEFPPNFASYRINDDKLGNLKKREFCHICVNGAGTSACNGKYVADCSIYGTIRYRHENGEYTIDCDCANCWFLSKNFQSPDYYKAIDSADEQCQFVPLGGWQLDETCIGQLPAPSITVVK